MAEHNPPKDILAAGGACRKVRKVTTEIFFFKQKTAYDIGTGSGVLAAILAKQGIPSVIGTDTNPRAVACARANIARLGFEKQVEIRETDLFPEGFADLIVCNPPWLPAKPTSAVESALYDPESAMLAAFLRDAPNI